MTQTLSLRSNVNLLFKPIPNVVYCSQLLLLFNVVVDGATATGRPVASVIAAWLVAPFLETWMDDGEATRFHVIASTVTITPPRDSPSTHQPAIIRPVLYII